MGSVKGAVLAGGIIMHLLYYLMYYVLCTINRAIDRIKLVLLDYIELGWR